jgi:hypothetical protein
MMRAFSLPVVGVLAGCLFSVTGSIAAGDKIVSAGPDGPYYVVPAASLVGAPTFGHGEEINVRFDGPFVLTGTFHTQGDADNRLTFLKPDDAVAARLPRWKESGRPTEIWFENAEAAIKAVLPPDRLAALNGGKIAAVDLHVTLDVDRYTVTIECDTANYAVRFLSVHKPGAVAQTVEPAEGC